MVRIAGIDGCRAGWLAVVWGGESSSELRWHCASSIPALIKQLPGVQTVAIDIPIGLLTAAEPGGRPCDRAARKVLSGRRGSSVFSPPVRSALDHLDDYAAALDANRQSSDANIGISKQCFHIMPKIAEADAYITPRRQRRLKEAHPELAFAAMNNGRSLEAPKRTQVGRAQRRSLLNKVGLSAIRDSFDAFRRRDVALDDLLDAAACCWVAWRVHHGEGVCLGDTARRDERGLRMEIWS